MSDEMKALSTTMAAWEAYNRGNLVEAIRLHQTIIDSDASAGTKVSAHIEKSFFLAQAGQDEEAAREAELALELDAVAMTREFDEEDRRALIFPNLDYEWLEQLKALGREGKVAYGIGHCCGQ